MRDLIWMALAIPFVVAAGIHWMEPRDLSLADALAAADGVDRPGLSSVHAAVVNVAFGDGYYRALHKDEITPELLGALGAGKAEAE